VQVQVVTDSGVIEKRRVCSISNSRDFAPYLRRADQYYPKVHVLYVVRRTAAKREGFTYSLVIYDQIRQPKLIPSPIAYIFLRNHMSRLIGFFSSYA
jgi:hypothetical protein